MTGAEAWFLLDDGRVRRDRPGHGVHAFADDDDDPVGAERLRRRDNGVDHRLTGDTVQHLRQRGLHPRSEARSEDDDRTLA